MEYRISDVIGYYKNQEKRDFAAFFPLSGFFQFASPAISCMWNEDSLVRARVEWRPELPLLEDLKGLKLAEISLDRSRFSEPDDWLDREKAEWFEQVVPRVWRLPDIIRHDELFYVDVESN